MPEPMTDEQWAEIDRLDEIKGLDPACFSQHPNGYTCRCGLPNSCVCVTSFPLNTNADLVAEVRRRGEKSVTYAEMAGEACNQRDELQRRVDELEADHHRVREYLGRENGTVDDLIDRAAKAERRANELEEELVAVRASVDRVRALHRRIVGSGTPHCSKCVSNSWPCPTIRALDGGA